MTTTNSEVKVLDLGHIRLIESWGSDERIIESARMSTAKGFLGWGPKCRACGDGVDDAERPCPDAKPGSREFIDCGRGGHIFDAPGDERLLKFLWDKQHATPFEMAGLVIEVKAPIVVFREWHRHRTQSYNEMSARYVPLPDENYIPSVERILIGNAATTNKQAQGVVGREVSTADACGWQSRLIALYDHAEEVYAEALALGIPKELARLPVPVARYSAMRASANLRNWLGFLKLRCDPAAQWEIRQYANALAGIVREVFPRVHEVAAASLGLP